MVKWTGRDLYEVLAWPEDYVEEVLKILSEEAEALKPKDGSEVMGGGE